MPLYSKQSQQMLVDLINASNPGLPVPLTTTNMKYGVPAVITPSAGTIQNTSIKLTAPANSQYIGNSTLKYRRIDLGSLFRSIPVRVDKYSPAATSASPFKISDLLATINTKYGTNLQLSDIVDAQLGAGTTAAVPAIGLAAGTRNTSLAVTAASTSYGFVGSFTLYWVQAPQDIASMITTPSLETARAFPGGLSVLDPAGTTTPYVVDLDAYNFDWTDVFNGIGVSFNNYLAVAAGTGAAAYTAAWQTVANQLNTNNPSGPAYYLNTSDTDKTKKGNVYGWVASIIIDLTQAANQALYPEANFRYFNRALVVDIPAASTWAVGRLFLHYNV